MQQSKQNVILYHLHPWECRNEEGRRVDWKKGREKQLGDEEERIETRIYNHWDWESMKRVEGSKRATLAANTSSSHGLLGTNSDRGK